MESAEINITYETLFELLRREKNRDELQALNATFYRDVVDYLAAKTQLMQRRRSELDFSNDDSRKLLIQMDNTAKIIRELFERREKKIILMALNKARTGSNIVDTTSLLDEERRFYDEQLDLLQRTRREVLSSLLNGRLPAIQKMEEPKQVEDLKMIRFLHSVPKFVGTELETYGPFEADEIASLPHEIADVLINKGRAEQIAKTL